MSCAMTCLLMYKVEYVSGREEYDIEIDTVTGKVLKFELDY